MSGQERPRGAAAVGSWGVLVLVLVALGFRVWGSGWGLPYLYHPDEDKIVSHALAFGKGDLNPHFFLWPSLQMYVMFFIYGCYYLVGWLLGRFGSPEDFLVAVAVDPSGAYLLGRWLSAVLGALTVGMTYAVGRRLYGPGVGLLGAVVLSVNYLHVKDSHYVTPDVPLTFLVMVAFWFAVRVAEEPDIRNYIGAGLVTGLATSVKYSAFVAAAPLLVAHLYAVKTRPGAVRLLSGRAWVAAALIPAAFVVGTPYSVLDFNNFVIDLWHQKLQVSVPVSMLERVTTLLFESAVPALGVMVYVFAALGAGRCLLRMSRPDVLLLSFPVACLGFLVLGGGLQYRYLMPAVPFFCLMAAVALVETARGLGRLTMIPGVWGAGLTAVATALLIIQPVWRSVVLDLSLVRSDTRTQAKEWIEHHIPAGSRVAVASFGPPLLRTSAGAQTDAASATVSEWQEHLDLVTEHAVWSRLKNSRSLERRKKYDSLVAAARERAYDGRPRYEVLRLRPVPSTWEVRWERGQVKDVGTPGYLEYRHFFDPAGFLSENDVQYVVLSSSMREGEKFGLVLRQRGELVHRVEWRPPIRWAGTLPLYSFHDPTLEIYRVRRDGA